MSVRIRPIQPAEYPLLEELTYRSYYIPPGEEPLSREVVFEQGMDEYFKGFGKGKDDIGLVAELDGVVVGATWARLIESFGYVDDETPELVIALLPGHEGQGIGGKLLESIFEVLRAHGYRQVSGSVDHGNPARRLYERLGFKTVAVNEEDDVIVKKLCDD